MADPFSLRVALSGSAPQSNGDQPAILPSSRKSYQFILDSNDRKHCLVFASDGDGRNLTEELVASLTTTSHASMETCGTLCVELRSGRRNRVG